MELRFNLTRADQRIFLEHLERHRRGWRDFGGLVWTSVAAGVLAGLWLLAAHQPEIPDWRAKESLLAAGLFALAYGARLLWRHIGKSGRWLAAGSGNYGIVLAPAGVSVSRRDHYGLMAWPDVLAFEEAGDYWYLYASAERRLILPKVVFADPAEVEAFAAEVRALWADHPDNRGRSVPAAPPLSAIRTRLWADLWANLRAGYRCAVFRAVRADEFRPSASQLALLLLAQTSLLAAMEYVLAGPGAEFNPSGLTDYSASALLFLLSGAAVGGLLARGGDLLRWLVMVAAAEWVSTALYSLVYALVYLAGIGVADEAGRWVAGLYFVCLVWNLGFVFRAMVRVYGCPKVAALPALAVYALFNFVAVHALPEQELFYPAPDETEQTAQPPRLDGEELFYRQARLLDEAVKPLAAGRPGITDLYFVGFAGQANEPVFAHEVEYAKDLFDRRFGTAGRSLSLVNSPASADRLPIANGHNLEAALHAVAQRMNRDEDVLFLFLTSHGSRDHQLSVRFWPLPLNDLPATRLKELLDQAGIKNRVIVVSACYSGGFLDVLKDDNSLILTAASRDRTSFGCGTESEFTYFGEAYFVQALQETHSFIEAFGKARLWIERREKGERKEPSLPQLHVGPGIMPKLLALEAGGRAGL
ncbi:C13 family peptidase [Methylomagnum sp.]